MLKLTESLEQMTGIQLHFYELATLDGDDVWQAAFDGVLAGVDEEIVAGVAELCRTEVHCLGNAEDFSGDIWVR